MIDDPAPRFAGSKSPILTFSPPDDFQIRSKFLCNFFYAFTS